MNCGTSVFFCEIDLDLDETRQFNRTTSTGNPHSYKKTYPKLTSSVSHQRHDLWIGLGCAFGAVGIWVCVGWIYYKKRRSAEPGLIHINDYGAVAGEIDVCFSFHPGERSFLLFFCVV